MALKRISSVAEGIRTRLARLQAARGKPVPVEPTFSHDPTSIPRLDLPSAEEILSIPSLSMLPPTATARISDHIAGLIETTQRAHREKFEQTCKNIPLEDWNEVKSVYEKLYSSRHLPAIKEKVASAIAAYQTRIVASDNARRKQNFKHVSSLRVSAHEVTDHSALCRSTHLCSKSISSTTPILRRRIAQFWPGSR